jgi:hypothetical protein
MCCQESKIGTFRTAPSLIQHFGGGDVDKAALASSEPDLVGSDWTDFRLYDGRTTANLAHYGVNFYAISRSANRYGQPAAAYNYLYPHSAASHANEYIYPHPYRRANRFPYEFSHPDPNQEARRPSARSGQLGE